MKKVFIVVGVLLFAGFIQPCIAGTFFDDFNDGNTDGWIATKPCTYCGFGNWRLEDGVLVEDEGRDNFMFLLKDYLLFDQSIEAKILNHDNGQAGFTIWHRNINNWVQVFFPYRGNFHVTELVDGSVVRTEYPFDFGMRIWRTLRVNADSSTGKLDIYFDGEFIATHTVATTNRTGLSGFESSNAGGSFDNFKITSSELPPAIDIRPWIKANVINIKNMKKINVALLATSDFSPFDQVDKTTLTFGATGNENSLLNCLRKPRDVNRDGLADLVCSFSTKLTGLKCGDDEVILKGKMKETGISFETKQDILIRPCKRNR